MSNATYYNIPAAAAAQMASDMDAAAKGFWAYPGSEWQSAFEAEWLEANGYTTQADGKKFALINNRGAQLDLYYKREEAQAAADKINAQNLDVFAWVVDAPEGADYEDMPGRGFLYG